MDATAILGFTAGTIHLSGYAVYGRKMQRGQVVPNAATWLLWVLLSSLNAVSYLVMSGDPAKSAVAFAGATACTIIFGWSLAKGRVSRIAAVDALALGVGVLAAASWIAFRSATYANLILQAGFIASMVPTYRAVRDGKAFEHPLPWFLWASAYILIASVVVLRWQGRPADLAYPLINLVTHGGICLLAATRTLRN